jgi:hypothetical protein
MAGGSYGRNSVTVRFGRRRPCTCPRSSAAAQQADRPLRYINRLFSANSRNGRCALIGQPVEYASREHQEHVAALVMDALPTCPPTSISFKNLFLVQDEEDEESASLADALSTLADTWRDEASFQAAGVAELVNSTGEWATDTARQRGETLREFLFPGIPLSQAVTAKATGKRLKRHVGEPVPRDGKTLSLKEIRDSHTKTLSFYIKTSIIAA